MQIKEVKIDKLTVMGDLPKVFETSFQLLLDNTPHSSIIVSRTSYVKGQFYVQRENSIYFEYDGLLASAMNRRNFKL